MSRAQGTILVVDDELSVRDSLGHWFRQDGYEVHEAENATEALQALERQSFDVALVDIKMPGMDGLELQERLHAIDPELAVIMITAFASVETAVRALKQGAFDYVTKPVDPDELSHLVRRSLEQRRLREENAKLRETIDDLVGGDAIVGESPPMLEVLELIRHVAQTEATVLIRGESGTGKELIARAIHAGSRRRYFPLVPINCGALPGELLESELFGHERGAFTGAQYRRKGKIEAADHGTLFLDEVGAVPPRMQVDLLRVLETKELTRLGANRPVKVDFRVICATNEDLERAVKENRFREDLYYRLNVFAIEAPPLRARPSDVPLLAEHFRQRFARQMDKRITGISPEAMAVLAAYDWPGNVRELSNAIERAMVVGRPPAIRPADLPLRPLEAGERGDSLSAVEKRHIGEILERTGWNITRAAETLGIDRVTVYNKIKKYGLRR
ncbi:MAG: sigma-54 dependent transcriptional regulator [Acidobacteriota bacterium]|nr:sigma-54 dependent transcriptional regulator [Acidobacteriota bacterium]MDH3523105.1 sigma-54 dependent transcriptional regulator [Acidobacteriota bacterium]